MTNVEQKPITHSEDLGAATISSGSLSGPIFSFLMLFCQLLLVFLFFFSWPLHYLPFFDLRLLICYFVIVGFSQRLDIGH